MDTETAQLFFGLLTLAAAAGGLSLIALRLVAATGNEGAARLGRALGDAGVWLAFLVAATATLGSLYFSEVADFVPCRLCWFQRIAMYPLSVILLVGALRKDAGFIAALFGYTSSDGLRWERLAEPFTVEELGGWSLAYPDLIETLWQSQIEPRLDLEPAIQLLETGE